MAYNPIMVKIDPAQIASVQSMFRDWPKAIPRIFKESINKTAGKARTDLVSAGSKLTGIKKQTMRRFTSIKKATDKNWTAYVRAWSRKIPIVYLDIDKGSERTKFVLTTFKQAIWLYHNVFKEKYGENAVFSRQYTIKRTERDFFYREGGRIRMAPSGSFEAKMKTGHVGIFQRRHDVKGAIREVTGPSLGEVLTENKIEVRNIEMNAMAGLTKDIDARISRYLTMRAKRNAAYAAGQIGKSAGGILSGLTRAI
jgi:hypothetical protein